MFKKLFNIPRDLRHWWNTHRETRIKIITWISTKVNKVYKTAFRYMQYISIINNFIQKFAGACAQPC